ADAASHLKLSVRYLPLEQLSEDELAEVLRIPFHQVPGITAVALVDAAGRAVAPPVYDPEGGEGREPMDRADVEQFARRVPLKAALAAGAAVGPPYRREGRSPRLAVAVRVAGDAPRVLAAELSLADVERRLEGYDGRGVRALLLDSAGAPFAWGGPDARALAGWKGIAEGRAAQSAQLAEAADGEWLLASVPVSGLGWTLAIAQPATVAFAPATSVRRLTLLWVGAALLLALVLGVLLARRLIRPVRALSAAVERVRRGAYDEPVPVEGRDELGRFAEAFNQMVGEVRRRDEEIRGWNAELQRRVDERTRELKEAQDQILRTRRLAAMASLGAGVAHELNNPLTAVMGLVGLVRRDLGESSPHARTLGMAIEQSRRMAKIVSDFRATTEQETANTARFPLATAVDAALGDFRNELAVRRIALETELDAGAEVQGDAAQLQQVVSHLVRNAIAAIGEGGALKLGVNRVAGDAVRLTVADSGRGIPPALLERIFDPFFSTKETTAQTGLGLFLCHNMVQAHHGRISVESTLGRGTTFTIHLPGAAARGHIV
ncbi:MAG: ATP-binding protein, partial [Myxococcales bacterium]